MNNKLNVLEMNDREYREYKRMIRRKRAVRLAVIKTVLATFMVLFFTLTLKTLIGKASEGENNLKFKYFTGVQVSSGDTLWELADEYIDYTKYSNKQQYINEVAQINHLNDNCDIRSGQTLIMPYYSTEFIAN